MATVNYGMGQYRYNPTFNYIDKDQVFDGNAPTASVGRGSHKNIEYFKNEIGGINYQDVLLSFASPVGTTSSNYIQYGSTYYMELTVPQHRQYSMTINLKLCAGDGEKVNVDNFQNIKRFNIPPTPKSDNFINKVIFFEDPTVYQLENNQWVLKDNIDKEIDPIMKASVYYDGVHNLYTNNQLNNNSSLDLKIHEVYLAKDSGPILDYWYITGKNSDGSFTKERLIDGKYDTSQSLEQNWNLNQEEVSGQIHYGAPTTVTYKFAFSPKYELSGGFPYLLIETDRSGNESHTIQYESGNESYNGTCLDLKKIKARVYTVSNLIGSDKGLTQIQSGSQQLTHIAVWGHPEQILTINGEEIKIGKSGFYEIKDYTITSLGVIVADPNKDRFTIDYEYKMIT